MFKPNEDASKVSWLIENIEETDLPTLEELKEALSTSPFAAYYFLETSVEEAIEQLALQLTQPPSDDKSFEIPVAEKRDAQLRVAISDDRMIAGIEVTGAFGGNQIDLEALHYQLTAEEVSFGINQTKLEKIAAHLKTIAPGEVFQSVVAHGKPPKAGEDGVVKQLARTAKDRVLRPREKEDGSVDMRDLGDLVTVATGTPLMERVPATEGAAGTDVCGKPIPPVPGKQPPLNAGSGTRFNDANPNLLESDREGVPVEIENGMMVDDVLVIAKVDVTTGHVRFKGSVIIEGDVGEGMEIESGGDITVGGSVSSATLNATGSITIAKGIIGRPIEHEIEEGQSHMDHLNCHVTANVDVAANFAQYASLKAGRNVALKRQASHCDIKAMETLLLGDEEMPRGKLLGGKAQVGERIISGEIGTTAGAKTMVDMSYKLSAIKAHVQESARELKRVSSEVVENATIIKQLKSAGSPDMLPMLKTAVDEYKAAKAEVGQLQTEVDQLKRELIRLQQECRVTAHSKLHSRLTVQFGRSRVTSERDYGPSTIKLTAEGLQITPL
ncbi:FapA family protein [Corallincola platygyrae]|uniref:FapA family protein n=1 Tax=Corallincola platygyrae TaxID=1193278 RepID=A0ABW4XN92_9GAMM